jgi:hypothetical protein
VCHCCWQQSSCNSSEQYAIDKCDSNAIHGSSDPLSFVAVSREEKLAHVRPDDWQHADSIAREQELLRRQTHGANTAAAAAAAVVVLLDTQTQLRQSLA